MSLAIWSYTTPITNYRRSHVSPPKVQSVVRTYNETIFYLVETYMDICRVPTLLGNSEEWASEWVTLNTIKRCGYSSTSVVSLYLRIQYAYIDPSLALSLFNSSIREPLRASFRGGGAANHLWMMRPHKAMCLVPFPPHPPGNAHASLVSQQQRPTTHGLFVTWYVSVCSFCFLLFPFNSKLWAHMTCITCRWKGLELPKVCVGVNLVPFFHVL